MGNKAHPIPKYGISFNDESTCGMDETDIKNLEDLLISKTDPEINKTVEAVLNTEIDHTKLAMGWLLVNTDSCFERAFISELLKKQYEKLKEKKKELGL